MLSIIKYPASVLRGQCSPVSPSELAFISPFVDEMIAAMYAAGGVGLAAPQLGLTKCIVALDPTAGQESNGLVVMVNPRVTWVSPESVLAAEGCLSLPGASVQVLRHLAVEVEYIGLDGMPHCDRRPGLWARIAQHEIDHLFGRLTLDHVGPIARKAALADLLRETL
jgi:peptide deformylase